MCNLKVIHLLSASQGYSEPGQESVRCILNIDVEVSKSIYLFRLIYSCRTELRAKSVKLLLSQFGSDIMKASANHNPNKTPTNTKTVRNRVVLT